MFPILTSSNNYENVLNQKNSIELLQVAGIITLWPQPTYQVIADLISRQQQASN